MKLKTETFRARPGKLRLKDHPTHVARLYDSGKDAERQLEKQVQRIAALQDALYAGNRWSLLLIFQAMDAAGKDGTIKHVMSGVNPAGCQVYSFKQPSAAELDHDFLWRTSMCLPERGRIGVFNRSYYEEVLVVRVHPEYLAPQRLPDVDAKRADFWEGRYTSIRDFEAHLSRNGTKVVKFFLNVSRDEQRKRFLDRIDDPTKNWKFGLGDVRERSYWNDYQKAYEKCIRATSTVDAPWYVVPADDNKNMRLIVARVIAETLESLGLEQPKLSATLVEELREARGQLVAGD